MSRYLKLVHMEIHRFRYILAVLMGITAILQITGLIIALPSDLKHMGFVDGQYTLKPLSFAWIIFNSQRWFIIPMLMSIAVLAIYVFLIWYRDVVGRSTFMYRLLMLPTARRHIYLAKITAIFLFVLSLLSFQMLLLFMGNIIFKLIVPADLRVESFFSEIIKSNQALKILWPLDFEQFLYVYGLGFLAIIVIFTAILLERCYRGIGILYGILYITACILLFLLTYFLINSYESYLYPGEMYATVMSLCGIVLVVSLLLSFRLLSKKITV
ncbi:hypothetical protein [Paenibacillus endoradicis]|uniref:hypothetical protein n=1 Tax=Paenibacillus endoradicis TaxID=2972487 RepID=UPI002158ACDE|nr:hypothetical protein [Paenibacillus endoradicis]MCR8659530.1 hypothetical protein [Paenibacillus endoradicis]